MALTYILTAFSQALPNGPVNVNVQAVHADPAFSAAVACEPITGLPDDFTNADLLAAVAKATGLDVQLPQADA